MFCLLRVKEQNNFSICQAGENLYSYIRTGAPLQDCSVVLDQLWFRHKRLAHQISSLCCQDLSYLIRLLRRASIKSKAKVPSGLFSVALIKYLKLPIKILVAWKRCTQLWRIRKKRIVRLLGTRSFTKHHYLCLVLHVICNSKWHKSKL